MLVAALVLVETKQGTHFYAWRRTRSILSWLMEFATGLDVPLTGLRVA